MSTEALHFLADGIVGMRNYSNGASVRISAKRASFSYRGGSEMDRIPIIEDLGFQVKNCTENHATLCNMPHAYNSENLALYDMCRELVALHQRLIFTGFRICAEREHIIIRNLGWSLYLKIDSIWTLYHLRLKTDEDIKTILICAFNAAHIYHQNKIVEENPPSPMERLC